MSEPSAPYYHKNDSDTYHWEESCGNNYYPAAGWVKTDDQPTKEQCDQCQAK